ncbi:L-lactate MFS transporter [Clostridium sp. JNZ J1-5]|nr:OFA family MFS transporter [Clostridium sp.]
MKEKLRNRWIILIASIICNLCIGAVYAWSVFQKPLVEQFKWTASDASWAFSLTLVMMPIAMTFAGKIADQKGPRLAVLFGGILFGIGMLLSGYATSLTTLYLFHGIIGGLGVGTVYGCAMTNTVKWFPDKKGIASGLIAAGLGSGAIVFAPLANHFIMTYNVQSAFKILGVIYIIAITISSLFIEMPPKNYMPAGWTPPVARPGVSSIDKNWKEMMQDPIFYVLCLMYVMGAVSGLMIIAHASPIGQDVAGLDASTAAVVVSILGLSNTLGRAFWGWISDLIGRYNALFCIFGVFAVAMFLISSVNSFVPFVVLVCAIGLGYGGLLGVYPTINADMFGLKNMGQNYGIMFFAFAIAAMIGPRLVAGVKQANGNYAMAFIIAAVMAAIGAILTLFVKSQLKKRQSKESLAD